MTTGLYSVAERSGEATSFRLEGWRTVLHEPVRDHALRYDPCRLHLFGLKGTAMAALHEHPRDASVDPQAYGAGARREAKAGRAEDDLKEPEDDAESGEDAGRAPASSHAPTPLPSGSAAV